MPSFQNPDGSFFNEALAGPVTVITPLTGTTYVARLGATALFVNPAGTIAALTIQLPPGPESGSSLEIGFFQIVTALTLLDHFGNAITGAPTAGAVGNSVELKWVSVSGTKRWVRWR